jgi:hypothetical protein
VTQPTQPPGTFNGQTVAGTAGGTATAVSVTPSAVTGIALAAAQAASGYLFGETINGVVSGRVWTDANRNGVVDAGETGLPGVTLVLTGTDTLGAAVNTTVTSGADGSFAFPNLRPGTYTVTQPTQPDGTVDGPTVAGSGGGSATAMGATPSAISGIVLGASSTASGNLFGELPVARLDGRVWVDTDNDGVVDAGESGIAGVVLALAGTNDLGAAVNLTVTTAADGRYAFTGLRPGTYAVTQPTQPPGTFNGQTVAGTAGGTATAVSVTPSAISGIALGAGQAASGYDFGEITAGQVAGRVWTDANNDGVIDPRETGLGGVVLTLAGTDDLGVAVNLTVTTAADGSYSFAGLRPGTYTITQPVQPAGTLNGRTVAGTGGGTATGVATTPSAISGIVLAAAQASSDNHFGEIAAAGLSGRVWADADNDGQVGAGEAGLAAVGITLSGTDDLGAAVTLSATTAADGSFAFSGLRPGTYAQCRRRAHAGGHDAFGRLRHRAGRGVDRHRLPVRRGAGLGRPARQQDAHPRRLHRRPDRHLPHQRAQCRQRGHQRPVHGAGPPARRPDAGVDALGRRLDLHRRGRRDGVQLQRHGADRRGRHQRQPDHGRGPGGRRRGRRVAGQQRRAGRGRRRGRRPRADRCGA